MSGHCAFPQTANPDESHARCAANGAGSTANPAREFQPCPCPCHFAEAERYECGNCGGELAEAPHWPAPDDPEEGDVRYTHIDPRSGRATGEECS